MLPSTGDSAASSRSGCCPRGPWPLDTVQLSSLTSCPSPPLTPGTLLWGSATYPVSTHRRGSCHLKPTVLGGRLILGQPSLSVGRGPLRARESSQAPLCRGTPAAATGGGQAAAPEATKRPSITHRWGVIFTNKDAQPRVLPLHKSADASRSRRPSAPRPCAPAPALPRSPRGVCPSFEGQHLVPDPHLPLGAQVCGLSGLTLWAPAWGGKQRLHLGCDSSIHRPQRSDAQVTEGRRHLLPHQSSASSLWGLRG